VYRLRAAAACCEGVVVGGRGDEEDSGAGRFVREDQIRARRCSLAKLERTRRQTAAISFR
jgi:hypothetical protein